MIPKDYKLLKVVGCKLPPILKRFSMKASQSIRLILSKIVDITYLIFMLLAMSGELDPYVMDTSNSMFYTGFNPQFFTGLFHGTTAWVNLIREVWNEHANLYCMNHLGQYNTGFFIGFTVQTVAIFKVLKIKL